MEEGTGSCCSSQAEENDSSRGISAYLPLLVIVSLSAAAAAAKQFSYGVWSGGIWMHDFMGIFLVIFAMVKLFDLRGFAEGFAKYDLLAGLSKPYGMVYPFLELGLGLGYLSGWFPELIYGATIGLLGFGTLGVLMAMKRGENLKCACMGSLLDVPVSVVTLTENLGMVVMAMVMWAM